MSNVLERIVEQKRVDIEAARRHCSLDELMSRAQTAPPARDFLGALQSHHPMGVIAEIKRASPSAGCIREDFDPVEIARAYASNGAACISILTDEHFFQGRLEYLEQVRAVVDLPLLRKDFLLDEYQVWEARAAGADCVLLIAECLTDERLHALHRLTGELGMQSLIELYDPDNLHRVLSLGPPLLGINNRNLRTFETDLAHTIRLRNRIPAATLVVGESGIHTRADVQRLQDAGVHGILVGESLMRSADIGGKLRELLAD